MSKTTVVEKIGSSSSEHPLAETGTIQTPDQMDKGNVLGIRKDMPPIASIRPAIDFISGEIVMPSTEAATTLKIMPEEEVLNQQIINSQPEQGISHVATKKTEKNTTLASETVDKNINITTESSKIQEKSSANLSSNVVVPPKPELHEGEAGISLQTSPEAETLENIFDSDTTSNVRFFQSLTGSTETKNDQMRIKAEMPVSKQWVAEPSEILAINFETNAGMIPTRLKIEKKNQSAETNLGIAGAIAKSETIETPDVNMTTVMMDLWGAEKIISQGRSVESDKTADLMGHVFLKTETAVNNKDIADEGSPVQESSSSSNRSIETERVTGSQFSSLFTQAKTEEFERSVFVNIKSQSSVSGKTANLSQANKRISSDNDTSKSITDERIRVQTAQDGITFETMPRTFDEASSQPEVAKVVESKNKETEIHSELPMDRSVQNETIPFHENKNKSDIEIKPTDFSTPVREPDEKPNTRTASINDAVPATNQASKAVEFVTDPVAPALSKAHPVENPDAIQKAKQTDNDEKILPVEKQPRLNQTLGIAASANGPEIETMTPHPRENIPSNQLHGDVKEAVDHVIRHINFNLKNGPTSMRLQLSPGELGAIDVQMVSDSQGVHVTFFAEQASTGKLLETQLDQLRVSLVDSGVHLSGLDIGQHNQSGQKGGSFEQSPNSTRDFSRNFPETQTVSQEKPSLERNLGRSSDIDYLI